MLAPAVWIAVTAVNVNPHEGRLGVALSIPVGCVACAASAAVAFAVATAAALAGAMCAARWFCHARRDWVYAVSGVLFLAINGLAAVAMLIATCLAVAHGVR